MLLILPKTGTFTFEEKKSKFIGFCAPVKTEQEAKDIIEEIRNANRSASHNVYAYDLSACNTAFNTVCNTVRFSDDGEPGGTAGMPVLNVFQKTRVTDFVCVVTRYYGGIQLGAGGLVRAYTKAAKGAMNAAGPEELVVFKLYKITCTYDQFDTVKHRFNQWGVEILDVSYSGHVEALVKVKKGHEAPFFDGRFYTFAAIDDTDDTTTL